MFELNDSIAFGSVFNGDFKITFRIANSFYLLFYQFFMFPNDQSQNDHKTNNYIF